jgi:hypothetical protein
MPFRDLDVVGKLVMTNLRDICDEATPSQYVARLELSATIRAYLMTRFAERFPKEYAEWSRHGTTSPPKS